MKKLLSIFLLLAVIKSTTAQLKVKDQCPVFDVDILMGRVNTYVLPTSLPDYVKVKLPCFTSAEAETAAAKCGGGVFYKDRDIYFYTARDYIEIGPKFKGKLSLPLIGAKRTVLGKWFGIPKLKDPGWEAYQTQYGCLVVYFSKASTVNKIIFSSQGTETLKLCE
jgi:hypothetical protein